ncbi:hypothetical protein Tco_1467240 [Tanacetum coccineum]
MDDPNITMEEYIIRLEEEKARMRGKVYNWETTTYGKVWYDEHVHDLKSVETEFPAIVFNDALTSEVTLSCETMVSPLNDNKINFRISFDESDDEDYTESGYVCTNDERFRYLNSKKEAKSGVYNSEDWGSLAELYIRPRKGMRISSDTVDDCTKQATHRNDNVISDISCVEQEGGTVDQHTATVEETRAYFESLYNNLALEVEKCEECKYDKISYDKAYNDMQQKIERLQAQLGDLKGKSKDTPCVSNTLDPLSQKLENENVELEFQVNLTALDGIMLTSNPSNQKSNGSKFYFLLGRFRVAFQKEIPCFVQILKEFDSLKGNRSTNFTPSITSESICQSPNFPQGSSNIYKVLQSKYKENPRRNMNVNLMRLSQVFFEKSSSKPGLQSMTSGQISLGLDLTYAPSTITTQKPTECELDLLFEAMYDDYMVSIASAPRTARFSSTSAQQTPTATTTQQTQHRQPTNSYLSTTN